MSNTTFLWGMMVLTSCYAGSLISFFSVEVYPSPPATMEQLRTAVKDDGLEVIFCCDTMKEGMEQSLVDSYRALGEKVGRKQKKVKFHSVFLRRATWPPAGMRASTRRWQGQTCTLTRKTRLRSRGGSMSKGDSRSTHVSLSAH